MTTIQDLIAESRLPGQFEEKRTFTFARQRAVEKMRQFALADPYFFILELVQAAVANGATYISVESDKHGFLFAYTGASYAEEELSQLFDFLLVGRARPELERIHGLSLGVNALLRFEPDAVEIVSGDGTKEGSVRAVVADDALEIGRPARAISGTFVKVAGMHRGRVQTQYPTWKNEGLWPDYFALEERCLTSPVPIVYNARLLETAGTRIPPLAGYEQLLPIDEGDLYGVLGAHLVGEGGRPMVKLLTHGVWIESVPFPWAEDLVGGVVCFDALHKTIDHAGIVRDERWDELWYRLDKYVDRERSSLRRVEGSSLRQFEVYSAEGVLRENVAARVASARIVYVSRDEIPSDILRRDGALGVRVSDESDLAELQSVFWSMRGRAFSSGNFQGQEDGPAVVWVDDEVVSRILSQPPSPLQIPECQVQALDVGPVQESVIAQKGLEVMGLADSVVVVSDPVARHASDDERLYVGWGQVLLTAYAPKAPDHPESLLILVRSLGRLVWRGTVPSRHKGLVLVAEYLDSVPWAFLSSTDKERAGDLDILVAGIVRTGREALEQIAESIVAEALDRAGSQDVETRGLLQRALAGRVEPVLRIDPDWGLGLLFVLTDSRMPDRLLDAPVFETLTGEPVSLRRLARMCTEQGGLVYGVVEGVAPDLEGLDQSRILSLTRAEEEFLVGLVGVSTYVRVDRRDVLAATEDGLECRDLALGLRDYPDFPLLVEPRAGATLPQPGTEAWTRVVETLVRGLMGTAAQARARDRAPGFEAFEDTRNARRHLQWVLARTVQEPSLLDVPAVQEARRLLLFESPQSFGIPRVLRGLPGGAPWAQRCLWDEVLSALTSQQGLNLLLRRHPGADDGAWDPPEDLEPGTPTRLLASPFEAQLLARVGSVWIGVSEVPESLEDPEPFLGVVSLEAGGLSGLCGLVPSHLVAGVQLLPEGTAPDLQDQLSVLAQTYGISAVLRLMGRSVPVDLKEVHAALEEAAGKLLDGFVERMRHADGAERANLESELLGLLSRGSELRVDAMGRPSLWLRNPHVGRLLDLELATHPKAGPITPRRLVEAFMAFGPGAFFAREGAPARFVPIQELPESIGRWVQDWLAPTRLSAVSEEDLQQLVAGWALSRQEQVEPSDRQGEMCRHLTEWLRTLRADLQQQSPVATTLARFLWQDLTVEIGAESWFPQGPRDRVAVLTLVAENIGRHFLPSWVRAKLWGGPGPQDWHLDNSPLVNPRVTLALNPSHWLVRWAMSLEAEALAALAVGVYGFLNEEFAPEDPGVPDLVTDEHELAFLTRLANFYEKLLTR